MTEKEEKKLAYAIGGYLWLDVKRKLSLAEDVASTFMWSGERRRKFLAVVEEHAKNVETKEANIRGESNINRLTFEKVGYDKWQGVPNRNYQIVKVIDQYRVFNLHDMIGGGITLEQAIEVAREHDDEQS